MPQAILLKDVDELGSKGAVVDVSKGYLRNFLIPRGLAQPATRGALEAARKATEAHQRAVEQATTRAQELADAINAARGMGVDRRKVHLEEPIRHVGTYMVVVEVADGVTATVKTIV